MRKLFLILMVLSGSANAQEEMLALAKPMAELIVPLRDCLRREVSKTTSNEEAQTIARNACADVRANLRFQLIELFKRSLNPMPPTFDVEKAADGSVNMVQVGAYYEYTGELKKFHDDIKRLAEERLNPR